MRALRTGVSGSGRREKLEAPVLRRQRIVHTISDYAIPLALFLIALAVRLYRLDAQSLWLDEGSSWQMARQSWATLLGDLLSPTAAYPLYHVLLKLWMALFGDSEFALRLPSALAGAVAVPVIYLAAQEAGARRQAAGDKEPDERLKSSGWLYPLAAAGIALIGPFPLWYAQEAKAYSLLLLAAALLMWSLLRALRTQAGRDWLIFGAVALVAIFIHRLASLAVLAGGWAWLGASIRQQKREGQGWRWAAAGGLALASAGLVTVMSYGLGSDRAATGAYIPAGPLSALGLTFSRFSLDRWPGDVAWWWLLPWVALLAWGLVSLGVDGLKMGGTASGMGDLRAAPMGLLCMLIVPLGLFVTQLLFTRLYEARYLIVIYPTWVLVLSYPLHKVRGQMTGGLIVLAALVSSLAALFQPPLGLFSGAPVKEQYREAISELAARVQPDDAVVIHPSYIRPLYDYYMGRLSTDPAPEPLVFADFWQGETAYGQREWDIERHAKLAGYTRSLLLIAPEHARTVDAPAAGTSDEYGLVGNFWAFSREQRTWPCGIWRYNGAHLLCQESPEAYITGVRPEPATQVGAVFNDNLTLLGYTLKATTPAGPGVYRAGGNLPMSLFWDVSQQPSEDFNFFLHLCQDCSVPPGAGEDGPPLEGYLPTSTWRPGKPARDDRAIQLPRDLAPGRYTLLLGVYQPSNPAPNARLTVRGGEIRDDGRLVLGTIEIMNGE